MRLIKKIVQIEHNGVKVDCHYYETDWSQSALNPDKFCPLCGDLIRHNDKVYMFFNNQVLFPNIVCHHRCTISSTIETVIGVLIENYEQARKALEMVRPWFGIVEPGGPYGA